jgi:hypothetical protein
MSSKRSSVDCATARIFITLPRQTAAIMTSVCLVKDIEFAYRMNVSPAFWATPSLDYSHVNTATVHGPPSSTTDWRPALRQTFLSPDPI